MYGLLLKSDHKLFGYAYFMITALIQWLKLLLTMLDLLSQWHKTELSENGSGDGKCVMQWGIFILNFFFLSTKLKSEKLSNKKNKKLFFKCYAITTPTAKLSSELFLLPVFAIQRRLESWWIKRQQWRGNQSPPLERQTFWRASRVCRRYLKWRENKLYW